jgi:hypothetical protein
LQLISHSLGGRTSISLRKLSQHPSLGGSLGIGGGSDDPIISASTTLAFAFGMAIGYGVWAAAPKVIGHPAPWDGSWPYYSTVLITASAVVALIVPRRYAAVLVGAALGQILAELILLTSDQRFLMTWGRVDLIGLLLTLPGTWLGSKVRDYVGRAA